MPPLPRMQIEWKLTVGNMLVLGTLVIGLIASEVQDSERLASLTGQIREMEVRIDRRTSMLDSRIDATAGRIDQAVTVNYDQETRLVAVQTMTAASSRQLEAVQAGFTDLAAEVRERVAALRETVGSLSATVNFMGRQQTMRGPMSADDGTVDDIP